jgi:DNA-binding PadR family transcriptional regulator
VLELAILGFLNEGPLAGHELRRRVSQLTGYTRPVSDGSLYPAITRLAKAGLLERRADTDAGPGRYVLTATEAGRADLLERLRHPAQHEITDFARFFVVLTFLSELPEVSDQHAVLRRRLAFLEEPASFFYDGDRPLHAEDVADPYRRGMLMTARAISSAERRWLREALGDDPPGNTADDPVR